MKWSDALPRIPDPVPNNAEIAAGMERKAAQRMRDWRDKRHADGLHQDARNPECEACQIVIAIENNERANAVAGLAKMFSPAPAPRGFRRELFADERRVK